MAHHGDAALLRRVLGFPLQDSSPQSFAVQAGATTLTFSAPPRSASAADSATVSHFAFNIPSDQIESACRWLRARVPVLKDRDGQQIVRFESWNASAVYFHDPAGNIVELIARHDLAHRTDGEFRIDQVLGVSEIGIAIPDSIGVVSAAAQVTRSLGLQPYRPINADFAAMGTEHGLRILVRDGRPWFMAPATTARIQPANVVLRGDSDRRCRFADLPITMAMARH
jgi:catechol 2,3-dioxygenase-like lactoylglutathione lyase family enzyme